jgi:hypothetical protein
MAKEQIESLRQGLSAEPRPHGTRARYMTGCKCLFCRAANSRYVVERQHAREAGDVRHIVNAAAARKHILRLARQGMGYKLVAESAKVGTSIVFQIRRGTRQRIRANTERAILAVKKELAVLGDASLVPSGATWKLLDHLLAMGYTKAQLALWMGKRTPAIQIKRGGRITAKTVLKVRKMYEDILAGRLKRDG